MTFLTRFSLKTHHIFTKTRHQILRLFFNTNKSNRTNLGFFGNGNEHGANFEYTVEAVLEKWQKKFEENSISEPKESIENILTYCLGTRKISDLHKYKDKILTEETVNNICNLCEKRLKKLPIQYVLGEWDFRSLCLKMAPPVFIPRPETEQLVDIVLDEIDRKNTTHILDLCCGSGAISLSLLHERSRIKMTAVDQSEVACKLTKENAQKHNLDNRIRIIQSQVNDLQYCINEKFDVIVSNPPYIYSEDLVNLQPEIKLYEDFGALNGGRDGLDVIRTILDFSSSFLNENGKLILEVEPRHPILLRDYLLVNTALRLIHNRTFKDFCGKDRFIEIMKF